MSQTLNQNINSAYQVITGAADIDLNKHAIIEASAGTGKTYTMVELVLRLMTDEQAGLPLDKILITTFTDNAANELKSRIRHELKQQLSQGGLSEVIMNRFNKALQHIESAPIYTIHGFCQRMSAEFAFESGEVFDKDLVDGDSVLESRFNAFVRTWPANTHIQSAFADYLANDEGHNLTKLKSTVLQLAGNYKPDFDVIYPPEPHSFDLTGLDNVQLVADMDTLESQFLQLHTNKGGKLNKAISDNWQQRVQPLLETLANQGESSEHKYAYLLKLVTGPLTDKGTFQYFLNGAPKAYEAAAWQNNTIKFPQICQQLESIFALITVIQDINRYKQSAIVKLCLAHLDKEVAQFLAQQGQVTYDRIIRGLYDLLHHEWQTDTALLTRAIRGKFSVAMIDEFQDTDPYQWQIFKGLFLDQDPSQHRLWVIGDPKQAIYGFRGADVSTYITAREVMQNTGAQQYRLDTNYRTIVPLINSFNYFFSRQQEPESSSYWYPEDSIRVAAADREKHPQLPRLEHDNSGLSGFNFIPLDDKNPADLRRTELAEYIAETIQERLHGRLQYFLKNQSKQLNYDDICILVKAKKDSVYIQKACHALNIPISIQKSKGLYQQPEATHFEVILSALHQPHNNGRVHNALSSLFFDHGLCHASQLSDSEQRQINQNWLQLLQWAKLGDWVRLFDWLVEDSGTRLRAIKNADYRCLANVQKIANTLCRYAIQQNAGIAELLRFYKKLRLTAGEREEDNQSQDTDHQAVKVMTMHSAKGLEFPVVFLFDGLSSKSVSKPYHKYYDDELNATVYDVSKQSGDLQKVAEHEVFKQLYYVAITRAIFKVFVPYVESQATGISDDYKNLIITPIEACLALDTADERRPMNVALAPPAGAYLSAPQNNKRTLVAFSDPPNHLTARSRFTHSFTSLSHRLKTRNKSADSLRFGELEKPTDEAAKDDQITAEEPLIPGSATTGNVLHGIFENIDFRAVIDHTDLPSLWADTALMSVVDRQMQQFKFTNRRIKPSHRERTQATDYQQQMAAWVWHTLRKPMAQLNGQRLGMIKPADRRHEMSFHWRHQGQQLTGFIDLLFRVADRQGGHDYYILDWKSNINAAGYAPEVLAQTVMQQHHYDLQYQIYAAAVSDWFQQLGLKNARLKGAIYVFSRGIDSDANIDSDDNGQGIYYHAFDDLVQQNIKTKQHILELTGP